jgi:class 3 adenylate cyclase
VSFLETIAKAKAFLQEHGRVSLRALKLEYELDDETLDGLIAELVDVQGTAALEGGVLSWIGAAPSETPATDPRTRAAATAAPPEAAAPPRAEGERRHLTVMFCDLVGSTELAEQLDPEEFREVVGAYQVLCAREVGRYDGTIGQYHGDGVLVYFGYPQAHDDDPIRAVHAALSILSELPAVNATVGERLGAMLDRTVEVRIGVHTGLAVVGEMGEGPERELQALGDTLNQAARLQRIAEPGTVVISEATRQLSSGVFVLEDLGPTSLKGVAEPVGVYRAVRATGVRSRLDLAGERGLTPLIGREQEVELLLDRWEQVIEGHGQVVLVNGDAGIGKSRLMMMLHERLAEGPYSWLEARGSAYHQNSALYPVIELLRQELLLGQEDSAEEKVAKLGAALEPAGLSVPEVLPLFATLLSVPLPERYPPLLLSPQAQRQRTLESLVQWLISLTRAQPMAFVVEDLHWIDPSTLELLGMLLEQLPTVPALLVLTFRPSFEPPWASRSNLVHLTLDPLTRKQVEAMVEWIAGGKVLPAKVLDHVVIRTDGVPLFVEELTKTVLESDLLRESDRGYERTDPLPELAIPSTLQDSLMARLDRLGPAKEVAQLGAVLGREFPYELLAAVSPLSAESLRGALRGLGNAELLYPRGVPPRAIYTFKHALIQETAYQSLLKSTRQAWHARIAQVLEERFPERVAPEPEGIARHCEQGALLEKAISYYQRAGEQATERSANAEAVGHLTRGIELLRTLPEGPERNERELTLQVALGAPLVASKGWGSREAEQAYERARELCEQIGETPQLFHVIRGLITFYTARAELKTAYDLCGRLLRLAEREEEASPLLVAHQQMAIVLYFRGKPSRDLDGLGLVAPRLPRPGLGEESRGDRTRPGGVAPVQSRLRTPLGINRPRDAEGARAKPRAGRRSHCDFGRAELPAGSGRGTPRPRLGAAGSATRRAGDRAGHR